MALKECERGKAPLSATLHLDEVAEEDDDEADEAATALPNDGDGAVLVGSSQGTDTSESDTPRELESGIDSGPSPQLDLDVFDDFIESRQMLNNIEPPAPAKLPTSPSVPPTSARSPSQIPVRIKRNPFSNPDPIPVYEASPSPETIVLRQKSKLSRAERIKLMRQKRAAGGLSVLSDIAGSSADERPPQRGGPGGRENRGPTPDVVQELKSLIHLVNEKRRGSTGGPSIFGATAPIPNTSFSSTPLKRFHSASSLAEAGKSELPYVSEGGGSSPVGPPPPIPPRIRPASAQAMVRPPRATRPAPPPPASSSSAHPPPSPARAHSKSVSVPSSPALLASSSLVARPQEPSHDAGFDTDTFGPPRDSFSASVHSLSSPPSSPVVPTRAHPQPHPIVTSPLSRAVNRTPSPAASTSSLALNASAGAGSTSGSRPPSALSSRPPSAAASYSGGVVDRGISPSPTSIASRRGSLPRTISMHSSAGLGGGLRAAYQAQEKVAQAVLARSGSNSSLASSPTAQQPTISVPASSSPSPSLRNQHPRTPSPSSSFYSLPPSSPLHPPPSSSSLTGFPRSQSPSTFYPPRSLSAQSSTSSMRASSPMGNGNGGSKLSRPGRPTRPVPSVPEGNQLNQSVRGR